MRGMRTWCCLLQMANAQLCMWCSDGAEHITVHEVQLDFLRHRQRAEVAAWHAALVDAYSADLDHIASVVDDGYIVNNIAHHLKAISISLALPPLCIYLCHAATLLAFGACLVFFPPLSSPSPSAPLCL